MAHVGPCENCSAGRDQLDKICISLGQLLLNLIKITHPIPQHPIPQNSMHSYLLVCFGNLVLVRRASLFALWKHSRRVSDKRANNLLTISFNTTPPGVQNFYFTHNLCCHLQGQIAPAVVLLV